MRSVWRVPLLLMVAMLAGLIGALIEDNWLDYVASAAIAMPLVVVAFHLGWRNRGRSRSA